MDATWSQMTGKVIPLRAERAETTDEALLAACAKGDNAALGVLFDRYQSTVYRFLARLSGTDARDLDDLVQATFIEVYRAAGNFRGGSAVKSWIMGIALNITRHHIRSEVRRKAMLTSYAENPNSESERPDESAERRQMMQRLYKALDSLPKEQREIFVLCDLEEIRGVDAAKILQIPEGTIWRRLHEARKALRAALEP
jgi:RNA polymerase sigma-70 factor (ECF subfamily)